MGVHKRVAAPQMTRPANTTAYTAGDLVANNTTAGSVVPLAFPLGTGKAPCKITGGQLRKSASTATAATFRLHLFEETKTVTNGDNGAIVVNSMAKYIGKLDFDLSGAGTFTSIIGGAIERQATAPLSPLVVNRADNNGQIYGLVEATGAYAPASGETFDVSINIER